MKKYSIIENIMSPISKNRKSLALHFDLSVTVFDTSVKIDAMEHITNIPI